MKTKYVAGVHFVGLVMMLTAARHADAAVIGKYARWPAGATINVWIQNIDPEGDDSRQKLFADGINRWPATFDRGYTINVNLGNPPANTPNLVRFTWVPPGTKRGGLKLAPLGGITGAEVDVATNQITGGQGIIDNTVPNGTAAQRQFIANLGMHEFTHALGLADDRNGVVTNSKIAPTGVMAFNARDLAEITLLYGRPPTQGGGGPR